MVGPREWPGPKHSDDSPCSVRGGLLRPIPKFGERKTSTEPLPGGVCKDTFLNLPSLELPIECIVLVVQVYTSDLFSTSKSSTHQYGEMISHKVHMMRWPRGSSILKRTELPPLVFVAN